MNLLLLHQILKLKEEEEYDSIRNLLINLPDISSNFSYRDRILCPAFRLNIHKMTDIESKNNFRFTVSTKRAWRRLNGIVFVKKTPSI